MQNQKMSTYPWPITQSQPSLTMTIIWDQQRPLVSPPIALVLLSVTPSFSLGPVLDSCHSHEYRLQLINRRRTGEDISAGVEQKHPLHEMTEDKVIKMLLVPCSMGFATSRIL